MTLGGFSGMRAWSSRHPYGAVFAAALVVRVTLAIVIALLLPQLSFFDDGTYSRLAAERLNGVSSTWDSYAAWLYVHTGTLLFPLTLLYRVFGVDPLVGPLFVAVFGAGVAALTARLVTHVQGVRRGVLAGLFVALLPSQVLVSSVLAKDALTWFLLSALCLVVVTAAKTASPRRVLWLVVLASGLLTLLGLLRLHTMTVAAVALLLAAFFGLRATRPHRLVGFAAVGILVPWLIGVGPLGSQLVANHGSLEGTRAYHASGGSAVEGLVPKAAPTTKPSSGATRSPSGGAGQPTPTPTAQVKPGQEESSDGAARNLAYLPRGITVILLEPLPWRSDGSAAFRLASLESLVWYPVLLLGLVGAAAAWPRREVLAFPVLAGGALVVMWALVDGNIGTAFRHRGEVVWAVVVLAAHGTGVLAAWRRSRAADDDGPRDVVEPTAPASREPVGRP